MIDPAEYDWLQHLAAIGDDEPVRLTALQLQKCAAIIQVYREGYVLWEDAVDLVSRFLQVAAVEAALGEMAVKPGTVELWKELQELPWPPVSRDDDPKPS